jgi:hypothetical protein
MRTRVFAGLSHGDASTPDGPQIDHSDGIEHSHSELDTRKNARIPLAELAKWAPNGIAHEPVSPPTAGGL